jgi:AraC family transcriptional regulator, arabinose operon regulatory protein
MPTDPGNPLLRHFATGHYREGAGYGADRPRGGHDWLLIATSRGMGHISHAKGDFLVAAGEVVLFQPHHRHSYRTASPPGHWELLWAHFVPPPTWTELLHWPLVGPGVMRVTLAEAGLRRRVLAMLKQADRLAKLLTPWREAMVLNRLEAVLLWCQHAMPLSAWQFDERIHRALEHIQRQFDQPLSVETLSKVARLSPSRFAHLFREQTGMTPLQAVEAQRLRYAQHLLEHTDLPVNEIARRSGFTEPFYFSRRFRHVIGTSPRAFRDRLHGA